MSFFTRRRLLQASAGAFGAIGLSQLALNRQATRYGQVLAQTTPRKVALLVGIDGYESNRLNGAVTDTELQRQLLIHRFGFAASDVHVLRDQQATRQGILGAFDEYLYRPVQAGDVVVFHFSGHGERVRPTEQLPEFTRQPGRHCLTLAGEASNCWNTAIAPYDRNATGPDIVQDIMGHTLLLLRAALAQKTENVTFVLDCCYAGGGKRGNAIMRSLDQPSLSQLNDQITGGRPMISGEEWPTQRQWLDRLGWREDDFAAAIESPSGPGFFIGAAKAHQLAADYSFDGFSAGAFTYLLTQQLWQTTEPLASTMRKVSNSAVRLDEHGQTPEYDPKPTATRSVSDKPIYHAEPVSPPAEALVLDSSELGLFDLQPADIALVGNARESLHLWLGGLDPQRLAAFDQGAIFSVVDRQTEQVIAQVQQLDGTRQGLTTQARLINSASEEALGNFGGQLLQERTRGIPDQVTLKVALDDTLTPDEQQTATELLGTSPDFDIFPVRAGQSAHILLGRYTEDIDTYLSLNQPQNENERPALGSIGIFSPSQVPLLAGSFDFASETVEAAMIRLKPRFISLHIGRMLALMVNGGASQLDVSVEVTHGNTRSGAATRGSSEDAIVVPQQSQRGIDRIVEDERMTITVKNNQLTDLHFGILVIDSEGEINVLFPPAATDDATLDIIRANSEVSKRLRAAPPFGTAELLVLASPQSLLSPLQTLRSRAPDLSKSQQRGKQAFDEEISAADVMTDLFSAMDTRRSGSGGDVIAGTRLLDVTDVAVLSLLFEIVPKAT